MGTYVSEIEGVVLTPLRIIDHPKGNILHSLKKSDDGFKSFGEAYFSLINYNEIKGWKKHSKMQLNLIVPIGEIEFIIFDEREGSDTFQKYFKVILSQKNYHRLTIEPELWVAFKGLDKNQNMLLNISSIEHDPTESENKDFNEIKLR